MQRKLDLLAEGQKIVADFYKEMGITPTGTDDTPYEVLKEQAYYERWRERRLI